MVPSITVRMMKSNIKEKGDISENSVPSREIMILSELFVLLICIVFFLSIWLLVLVSQMQKKKE